MDKAIQSIKKLFETSAEIARKAQKAEKRKVSINPDTYIAKEIIYQTALLKSIQHELSEIHILLASGYGKGARD